MPNVIEYLTAHPRSTQLSIMRGCGLSGAEWREAYKALRDAGRITYTISEGHLKYYSAVAG